MSKKHFSMLRYWDETTKTHTPLLHFNGNNYAAWREAARNKYYTLLGGFPAPVPFDTEIEYSLPEDGLIRERISFDVEEELSLPCYLLRPADMQPDKSHPAIICLHGHVPYAKDIMAGMHITAEHDELIRIGNYDMAVQMARRGYVTLSPDLRGFGERRDRYDPIDAPFRDTCNVQFLKGAIVGKYTMAGNIHDIRRCVDYLSGRPEVNPNRIGALGLGMGGGYAVFAAAADERIKAVDCAGFLNPWRKCGIERGANICGMEFVPDLWKWLDMPDIAGILAGQGALMLEMGLYDDDFPFADLMQGYQAAKYIFDAAGVGERLWANIHTGGHKFSDNKTAEFFERYL